MLYKTISIMCDGLCFLVANERSQFPCILRSAVLRLFQMKFVLHKVKKIVLKNRFYLKISLRSG
jgi:hypothetical protein